MSSRDSLVQDCTPVAFDLRHRRLRHLPDSIYIKPPARLGTSFTPGPQS